jgi:hypothetical protein
VETPGSYRSTGARVLYVAWAVVAWLIVVIVVVNKDSSPSVGPLALLALTTALLGTFGVRAWRLALEVGPHHVMVRNLFRSYRIPASDLRAASFDGTSAVAPGYPRQVVEAECLRLEIQRSPYSVDVVATMWLPADEKRALLWRLKRMIKNH